MFVYSAVYSVFPQNTVTEYKSLNAIIHVYLSNKFQG